MTADGTNKKDSIYRYYSCKTARRKKDTCEKKLYRKDRIEQCVVNGAIAHLQSERVVNIIADYIVKFYNDRTDENALKTLNARIQHTESQIETTTNVFIQAVAMNNEILKRNCDTKIKELQTLADDLQTQHSQLLLEQNLNATKPEIIAFVKDLFVKLNKTDDANYLQKVIDIMVRAVYVWNDRFIVWFYFDGGNLQIPTPPELSETLKSAESSAPVTAGLAHHNVCF